MSQPVSDKKNVLSYSLISIAILFACAWLLTLGLRKLANPDEGRYAEIPREMAASGDWITPRLNDLKYFEKPPLQYWGTAAAYRVFGTNEFAARFWCGLTGLAGVFLAGWAGARLFGRDAGVISAAVLASSLMYVALGHLNTLDMGLSFFLELAIVGFLLAQRSPSRSSSERNFMLLAWSAAALAVLSKGIVAIALPLLTLLAYTVVEREYSAWRRLHFVAGSAVFLLIAAPWFVLVSFKNPEFAEFFFLREHFQRFLTDVADRVEPWWYFLPLLLAGALPWTGLALCAAQSAWRSDHAKDQPAFRSRRFLLIWIVVTLLFFSVSHSKLPPYIVPVYPAVALLIGDYALRAPPSAIRRHLIAVVFFWLLALCYVVFAPLPTRRDVPAEIFAEVFRFGGVGFALALLGAACAWLLARKDRLRDAMLCACAGSFLAISALLQDFQVLRQLRSGYDLAQTLVPFHDPNKPFYSLSAYDHSLSFYLRRAVTIVGYRGELVFGQQQEPAKSLPTVQAFIPIWQHDPSGSLAVMTRETHELLAAQNVPMTVIGRDLHLIAVKKP